jgi:excisionase family DNA binding protein
MDAADLAANWLTTGEVAERLQVSGTWVRQLAGRGVLPCVKTRRGRFFPTAAVEVLARERQERERLRQWAQEELARIARGVR